MILSNSPPELDRKPVSSDMRDSRLRLLIQVLVRKSNRGKLRRSITGFAA